MFGMAFCLWFTGNPGVSSHEGDIDGHGPGRCAGHHKIVDCEDGGANFPAGASPARFSAHAVPAMITEKRKLAPGMLA
jgi:hypothetical protein